MSDKNLRLLGAADEPHTITLADLVTAIQDAADSTTTDRDRADELSCVTLFAVLHRLGLAGEREVPAPQEPLAA